MAKTSSITATPSLNGRASGKVIDIVTAAGLDSVSTGEDGTSSTSRLEGREVIARVREGVAQRKERALREYRQVVLALASDEDPGDVDFESLLVSTGKSFDQLDSDVVRVKRRRDASELRKEAELSKQRESELEQQLAQVRTETEELSRKYREAVEPLISRQNQLQKESEHLRMEYQSIMEHTQQALSQTADPAINEELDRLQKQHSNCLEKLNFIVSTYGDKAWTAEEEEQLREFEKKVAAMRPNATASHDDIDRLRRWKARKAYVAELPDLKDQMREIERKQAEVGLRKLDWKNFAL